MLATPEFSAIRRWFSEGTHELAKRMAFVDQEHTRLVRSHKYYDCTAECDHLTHERLSIYDEAALALFAEEILSLWKSWRAKREAVSDPSGIDKKAMQAIENLVRSIIAHATSETPEKTDSPKLRISWTGEDEKQHAKSHLLAALIADEQRLPQALSEFDLDSEWPWFGRMLNKLFGFHGSPSPQIQKKCVRLGLTFSDKGPVFCQRSGESDTDMCCAAFQEGQKARQEKDARDETVDAVAIANAERAYEKRERAQTETEELKETAGQTEREIDEQLPQTLADLRREFVEKKKELTRLIEAKKEAIEANEHKQDSQPDTTGKLVRRWNQLFHKEHHQQHVSEQIHTFNEAIDRLETYLDELDQHIIETQTALTLKKMELDTIKDQLAECRQVTQEQNRVLTKIWKPEDALQS